MRLMPIGYDADKGMHQVPAYSTIVTLATQLLDLAGGVPDEPGVVPEEDPDE